MGWFSNGYGRAFERTMRLTLAPKRVKEVQRQLANYRKFKKLTQEWVNLAIELCKLKTTQEDKN